jgi:hypothetical protein
MKEIVSKIICIEFLRLKLEIIIYFIQMQSKKMNANIYLTIHVLNASK